MSVNPTTSGIGRFTALVLGIVVFVCVAMIGGTGYLKYQLDRAEITLAAPDNAVSSGEGNDQSAAIAAARLVAQNKLQFWAMLLTLVCWSSLIIAAACAAGIYLVLRDKQSAPMRALAQSIQNMARGDMRTAIWGVERQDMIGELARAMDIARYHFSHLPDVSLLSEQGPVRLRFEGGARSLFEAMMKAISSDSDNIRAQSSALTSAVKVQKESIEALTGQVESILQSIAQRGQNGEMQIAQAINGMVSATENLKNAHAHAADQLNRLIPNMQDRAQGLAEITHIAGKQMSQTLQSLAASDMNLKANAEQAKETMEKLSSTADDLGTRLFGAINLLQASGKVMTEVAENVKNRLGDAATPLPVPEISLAPLDERLGEIARRLTFLQAKLDVHTNAQNIVAAEEATAHQQAIVAALDEMNGKITALAVSIPTALGQNLQEFSQSLALQDSIADLRDKIAELAELNGKVAVFASALPGDMRQAVREELLTVSEKNNVTDLTTKISELAELNGRVAVFASALPGDMRQAVREELQTLSEQNDSAVLGERLTAFQSTLEETKRAAEAAQAESAKPTGIYSLPPELHKQLLDQWFQLSAQIEASRASLADSIAEQIKIMESRLAEQQSLLPKKTTADYTLQIQIEKQTEILTELVATLALLDTDVQRMKTDEPSAQRGEG